MIDDVRLMIVRSAHAGRELAIINQRSSIINLPSLGAASPAAAVRGLSGRENTRSRVL
jgi:hypothetical protein